MGGRDKWKREENRRQRERKRWKSRFRCCGFGTGQTWVHKSALPVTNCVTLDRQGQIQTPLRVSHFLPLQNGDHDHRLCGDKMRQCVKISHFPLPPTPHFCHMPPKTSVG